MVFDAAGNLIVADAGGGKIYEYSPNGARTTLASGLLQPQDVAIRLVPEPSVLSFLAIGAVTLVMRRR